MLKKVLKKFVARAEKESILDLLFIVVLLVVSFVYGEGTLLKGAPLLWGNGVWMIVNMLTMFVLAFFVIIGSISRETKAGGDNERKRFMCDAMNEVEDVLRPLEEQFEKAGIYLRQILCRLRTCFCISSRALRERGFFVV